MGSFRTPPVLLVDIGNTRMKWAWLSAGGLSAVETITHNSESAEPMVSRMGPEAPLPEKVAVANVAGKGMEEQLRRWTKAQWSIEPEFARSEGEALGVKNGYHEPGQLGVDRWLALIATYNRYRGPACIVDCGSATTIDVLGREGLHLGGVILPGFAMMRTALRNKTRIPPVKDEVFSLDILGRDTASCISAGGLHATAALVERAMAGAETEIGSRPQLILTGGGALCLRQALDIECELEPELVLRGLVLLQQTGNL